MNIDVDVGTAGIQHFELAADSGEPEPILRFGWETFLRDLVPDAPAVAMGPDGRFIWARTGRANEAEDVSSHGIGGELMHRRRRSSSDDGIRS